MAPSRNTNQSSSSMVRTRSESERLLQRAASGDDSHCNHNEVSYSSSSSSSSNNNNNNNNSCTNQNGHKGSTSEPDNCREEATRDANARSAQTGRAAADAAGGYAPSAAASLDGWRTLAPNKLDADLDSVAQSPVASTSKMNDWIELEPARSYGRAPRLVHLCTSLYSLMQAATVLISLTLVRLLFTRYFYLPLAYFLYIYLDRNACNRGGRRLNWFWASPFWSYLAAHFPIRLRYSRNFLLDPNENYILGYTPHGIAAFGAVTAFATNGLNWRKLFPGITARFMVHEKSFIMPVMREIFLFRGDCSVNSRSIDYMLTKESKGNLLTIVVGGLAEADLSDAATLKAVVKNRKGFVKKALQHGANIIPCIAFGENSVFTKVTFKPGTFWDRFERRWYEIFKFKHPAYYGRCIFNEAWRGIMPRQLPITVAMGDPILVGRKETPSQADIDELHALYIRRLQTTYEANSDLCSKYDRVLELI